MIGFMNSWKTTISGLGMILTGLGLLGKVLNDFGTGEQVSFEQVALAFTTITTGIGLVAARDNSASSEEAGAK
jgi:hypothetical protein